MKRWGWDPRDRRENWFVVPAPPLDQLSDALNWSKNYGSSGRYYYHYTNTRWWFELEEDAIYFALRFS